jgi:hypothetical protein
VHVLAGRKRSLDHRRYMDAAGGEEGHLIGWPAPIARNHCIGVGAGYRHLLGCRDNSYLFASAPMWHFHYVAASAHVCSGL